MGNHNPKCIIHNPRCLAGKFSMTQHAVNPPWHNPISIFSYSLQISSHLTLPLLSIKHSLLDCCYIWGYYYKMQIRALYDQTLSTWLLLYLWLLLQRSNTLSSWLLLYLWLLLYYKWKAIRLTIKHSLLDRCYTCGYYKWKVILLMIKHSLLGHFICCYKPTAKPSFYDQNPYLL